MLLKSNITDPFSGTYFRRSRAVYSFIDKRRARAKYHRAVVDHHCSPIVHECFCCKEQNTRYDVLNPFEVGIRYVFIKTVLKIFTCENKVSFILLRFIDKSAPNNYKDVILEHKR